MYYPSLAAVNCRLPGLYQRYSQSYSLMMKRYAGFQAPEMQIRSLKVHVLTRMRSQMLLLMMQRFLLRQLTALQRPGFPAFRQPYH